MYDDIDYRFNWGKLIIKVVIFVILILLAILVISKTVTKNSENNINKNMTLFKEAAVEYFKGDKLPDKLNDTEKVTLKDLIKENLVSKLVDENNKSCDIEKSQAVVTKLDENYELMLKLYCGDKSKIVKSTIKDKQCSGDECSTDNNEDKEKEENKQTNSNDKTDSVNTDNNKGNNTEEVKGTESSETVKKTYYEFVKENKVYSDWQLEKITGNNVEKSNKNILVSEYCKLTDMKYYSTNYVTSKSNPFTYTIKLLDIPSNTQYLRVLGTKHYDSDLTMYRKYLNIVKNGKNISLVKATSGKSVEISDVYSFRDSSLKSSNFSFDVSQPYKCDKNYCVDININVKNLKNVEPYYASNLNMNVYFTPVHFYGEYADPDSCVIDTNENAAAYTDYKIIDTYKDDVTVYRSYSYEKDYNDVKWSTESNIDGYVKTGKSELR